MSLSEINELQIQELKKQLGIETTLALHYTTYKSGSAKKVIERGYIQQDAVGDLKKKIITVMTGSIGYTILRLIYETWPEKEPQIKIVKYQHKKG